MKFEDSKSTKGSSCIESRQSEVEISSSIFTRFEGNAITIINSEKMFSILDSEFNQGGSISRNGGAIRLENAPMNATSTTFSNIEA